MYVGFVVISVSLGWFGVDQVYIGVIGIVMNFLGGGKKCVYIFCSEKIWRFVRVVYNLQFLIVVDYWNKFGVYLSGYIVEFGLLKM